MSVAQTAPTDTSRLLLLTAPDRSGLLASLDAFEPGSPANLVTHRGPGPRLALLHPTPERLAIARNLVAKGRPVRRRADLWFSPAPLLADGGGIAFIFPGLEGEFAPRVHDVARHLGVPAPEVSTASLGHHGASVLAVARLLDTAVRGLGIRPSAVAGHSIGEWAAMIAGGIVSGAEFDAMVQRADLGAMRVPGVEFAVLGCAAERVRAEIAHSPEIVISHENSAHQTVICGPREKVAEVVTALRSRAVLGQTLPFRSGFHTPMLAPYLGYFRRGVPSMGMRAATTPVWSATTAAPFPADPGEARELCLRHLVEPVRFRQLAGALYRSGVRAFVQLGPGQLGSLIDDTLRHDLPGSDFLVAAANSPHRTGLDQLRRCAAALWVEGAEPDFAALDQPPATLAPRPAVEPDPAGWPGVNRLSALGATLPLAAELARFLDDTADAAAAVLNAATRPARRQALDVSLRAMPYLRDHCLARQRSGWPTDEDLHSVMPGTTMVAHMIEAAGHTRPGLVATAIEDIRLHRWLPASPPRQVTIDVTHAGADRVHVRLGEHAEGTVLLGRRRVPPAERIWTYADGERAPELTSEQMYRQGWMLHGPAFRGMTRAIAVSDTAMRGLVTVPEPPGALLDNLGQLLGHWLIENQRDRWIALPARIGRIELHGPEPEPGSVVECQLRVTDLDPEWVAMDARLCRHGVPVLSVRGWVDRRFDGDERVGAVYRMPSTATVSQRHPDGWWWVAEHWRTLPSRELYLRRYSGGQERAEYERLHPSRRRGWLLELVAAKDAVRGWLWENGAGPIYPAELRVHQDAAGRCRVTGEHGLDVPDLRVAVARHAEVAAARVRPAGSNPPPSIEVGPWEGGSPPPEGAWITNPGGLPPRGYRVRSA